MMWTEEQVGGGPTDLFATSVSGEPFSRALPVSHRVRLNFATFDPLDHLPDVPQALAADSAEGFSVDADRLWIVQFITPPFQSMVNAVRSAGAEPLIYLPDECQVVRMTSAERDRVAAMPLVRWVGEFHPAYKLDSTLRLPLLQDPAGMPVRRYSIMVFERGPRQQQAVVEHMTGLGAAMKVISPEGFRLQGFLSGPQLLQVVRMNEVQFVDVEGESGDDMDIARRISGATPLLSGLGILGQGVRGE